MQTLKRSRDFDRVFRAGRSVSNRELILYYFKKRDPSLRVGFCISRKMGKAVIRNRLRRRLREVYRHHHLTLQPGWDLILLARAGAITAKYKRLEDAFLELSQKAGLSAGRAS